MYLLKKDYLAAVTEEDLNILSFSGSEDYTPEAVLAQVEESVIFEVSSYLSARYDLPKIFFPVNIHASGDSYSAGEFLYDDTTGNFYTALVDTQANDPLTNEAKYKEGDTRNALVKRHVIAVVLYELHSRINPRNIPEFRIQRRDDAISWLSKVSDPRNNVDADFLPVKTFADKKGNDISWNSKPKLNHYY